MAGMLTRHRHWEDWLSMLLGVAIGLSPWLAGEQSNNVVMWNAVLVGVLVLAVAELEYVALRRWEEWCEIALGLWTVASPFVFGYADSTLATLQYALGAGVIVLAALELWQDWRLSETQLAAHGE